jgi:chemotaxis protein CheX
MTAVKTLTTNSQTLIQPCIESTKAVFSMMLGWDVQLGTASRAQGFQTKHDVSGIIGFSGVLRATVVVSVDQEVAFAAAEAFLGERPTEINADIIDMVGELANMIGGNAKDRLGIPGIDLGLPTIVSGKGHTITFEPGAHVELLPFTSPWGPFTVEVGLRYR